MPVLELALSLCVITFGLFPQNALSLFEDLFWAVFSLQFGSEFGFQFRYQPELLEAPRLCRIRLLLSQLSSRTVLLGDMFNTC